MGDSENDTKPPPADQHDAPAPDTTDAPDLHDVARRFLRDEAVKGTSRERKAEYLKEKGLNEEDINALLDESENSTEETQTQTPESQTQPPDQNEPPATETHDDISPPRPQSDNPPIITYPEFLTKPTRPPPLVTGTALLNTLYACAGLTTLLYGTSKYAVAPMVESLTEARYEFHQTTADKLSVLTRLLESTVSEIPPTASTRPEPFRDDADSTTSSDAEDPTELFHRDIGVQTSLPASPAEPSPGSAVASSAAEQHASKLAKLSASLKDLQDASVSQSEELADVKAVMDLFKDDLGTMTFPGPTGDFVGGFSLYGAKKNEPEDEIKKARDNIRRVKGVMLSTRNFPASAR
ncbi:peroxin 14/17 [Plectosphaerella plurivora]|uniref:Peroxisomal membrane protein PEX14 n=1 Tax=Plectosphaerella plurivora TaxID=936078 RepID=A0A9P8VBM5_9PEZI|nr:peroxin 14/17 [Plectosphaerella plurivora]